MKKEKQARPDGSAAGKTSQQQTAGARSALIEAVEMASSEFESQIHDASSPGESVILNSVLQWFPDFARAAEALADGPQGLAAFAEATERIYRELREQIADSEADATRIKLLCLRMKLDGVLAEVEGLFSNRLGPESSPTESPAAFAIQFKGIMELETAVNEACALMAMLAETLAAKVEVHTEEMKVACGVPALAIRVRKNLESCFDNLTTKYKVGRVDRAGGGR